MVKNDPPFAYCVSLRGRNQTDPFHNIVSCILLFSHKNSHVAFFTWCFCLLFVLVSWMSQVIAHRITCMKSTDLDSNGRSQTTSHFMSSLLLSNLEVLECCIHAKFCLLSNLESWSVASITFCLLSNLELLECCICYILSSLKPRGFGVLYTCCILTALKPGGVGVLYLLHFVSSQT